jgi:ceramide synthetase
MEAGSYIQCLPFRWVFYTGILVYGFFCLWDKPWFWNIRHCWYDYPYHQVGTSSP